MITIAASYAWYGQVVNYNFFEKGGSREDPHGIT